VRLKHIFPAADAALLIARRPSLALREDLAAVEAAGQELRDMLPGVDIDRCGAGTTGLLCGLRAAVAPRTAPAPAEGARRCWPRAAGYAAGNQCTRCELPCGQGPACSCVRSSWCCLCDCVRVLWHAKGGTGCTTMACSVEDSLQGERRCRTALNPEP